MARRPARGGATPATEVLDAAGVAHLLVPYTHAGDATDYGAEVVRETGRPAETVFKTLVVSTGPRALAVGVVPVPARLDLKALAASLGVKKAELAAPAAVERSSGYVLGGVSPLGQRTTLPTVIDASALAFDRILVSAGRRGLQVELDPRDLGRLTGAAFAAIAR